MIFVIKKYILMVSFH